ncbi:hypothetical protein C4569_02210 [Candidatus Parcubacteria bacterium]|nr:MAG: hypothetical protein C4569_02210 [Candidatus Parcubacteria bacterium]
MIEKWKILVLLGAAVWAVFFVVIGLAMFFLKEFRWAVYILDWLLAAALGFYVVKFLLKKYGGAVKEAFTYGAIMLGVSIILDLGITAPWFFEDNYAGYFKSWHIWVGVLISLLSAGLAGYLQQKKSAQKQLK